MPHRRTTHLLIKACVGKALNRNRRDEAIGRLWLRLVCVRGSLIGMQLSDIDLQQGRAIVRARQGGKGRAGHLGRRPPLLSTRYVPRPPHPPLSQTPRGAVVGGPFSWRRPDVLPNHDGLTGAEAPRPGRRYRGFSQRHLLRHTAATRWAAALGGSDGVAWPSPAGRGKVMLEPLNQQ